jgi:hypothetical protein
MSSTNFEQFKTPINADWLNDVDAVAYGVGQSSGASLVGYLPSGTGAVATTVQEVSRRTVYVFDRLSAAQKADAIAGTLTLDMSAAIQAAIDEVCPTVGIGGYAGKVISDPRYPLRVDTCLNMSNSRVGGTQIRDGLEVEGLTLVGNTGSGNAVVDVTGSQWLRGDINITTTGATTKSTVGVLQALSSTLTQTQNQRLKLRILMHDDAAANGGIGTVGLWNFGAEENTYEGVYIQANIPAFITSYKVSPNLAGTIPPSYQTLATSHSTGVNTFEGETFLVSLNRRKPCLITEDVNSLVFTNLYMSNIGAGGGNLDAWWQFGGFQGGSIQGTIEQLPGIRIAGLVTGAKLRFTFGALLTAVTERIVLQRGGQGQLQDCDIDLQDNASPNRPLLTATPSAANELISCYIQNSTIKCNADKAYLSLPENLLWNPRTGNVTIEGLRNTDKPYRYTIDANGKHSVAVPITSVLINAGITSAEVVRLVLPTITGAANALSATVRLTGIATILGSSTGAKSTRYVDAVVAVSLLQTGVVTVSASTLAVNGPQADANSGGNSITALAVSGTNNTTYVSIIVTPTRTGVNLETVQFIGEAEMRWSGNESRAPSLQVLS